MTKKKGILLFFLLFGFFPFKIQKKNNFFYYSPLIQTLQFPISKNFISLQVKDLLQKILIENPNERISLFSIKNHIWFSMNH